LRPIGELIGLALALVTSSRPCAQHAGEFVAKRPLRANVRSQ
jgi:hypothetical protein